MAGYNGCGIGCGSEVYTIYGYWTETYYSGTVKWRNATSHSVFIRIKKPDIYQGTVGLANPVGGYGKGVNFQLVIPQVGTSNLAIDTASLPDYRMGVKYLAKLSASGGKPPYSWIPVMNLATGLNLIRTGPKAGTITGIYRENRATWVLVIVRDKIGHSAFAALTLEPAKS
jgi:hypothetical protein